jgi:ubiquinone/menaquinone biosynthesis C-methylase UbiE
MKSDLEMWLQEVGERSLREAGIRKGQIALDFGCGSGNYTIPVARTVGEEGRVYALDKDKRDLNEMMQKAESEGLENIERIETSGELRIELEDKSVDVVLLYDVLHYWYFPRAKDRRTILREVYRILRTSGFISFYPGDPEIYSKYSELKTIIREIESANFHFESEHSGTVIHENAIQKGHIMNFRKK